LAAAERAAWSEALSLHAPNQLQFLAFPPQPLVSLPRLASGQQRSYARLVCALQFCCSFSLPLLFL
jgi:hypothetical protein